MQKSVYPYIQVCQANQAVLIDQDIQDYKIFLVDLDSLEFQVGLGDPFGQVRLVGLYHRPGHRRQVHLEGLDHQRVLKDQRPQVGQGFRYLQGCRRVLFCQDRRLDPENSNKEMMVSTKWTYRRSRVSGWAAESFGTWWALNARPFHWGTILPNSRESRGTRHTIDARISRHA